MEPRTSTGEAAAFIPARFGRCALTAVLAFCLTLTSAFAQSGDGLLTGRVSNAITGQYLTNARVSVQGTNTTVYTDSYGEYCIPGVAGTVTLEATYPGLDSAPMAITATAVGTTTQNFALTDVSLSGEGDSVVLEAFEVAIFVNARNDTNQQQELLRYGDEMPAYAYQNDAFAVQYTIGVKGTF